MFIRRRLFTRFIILSLFLFSLLSINLAYSASNVFVFNKNLTLGNVNNDVKELQKYLNNTNYLVAKTGPGSKGKETTMFGRATKASLIKFQQANNIKPVSGYFGPLTRDFINKKNKLFNNNTNNQNNNNQSNNTNNNNNPTGYIIGGSITGLGGPVTIQNNNNQETITINPGDNSEFTFKAKQNTNTNYLVTIKQNYLGQSCFIKDNTGIVTNLNITTIKIACGIKLYFNPFTTLTSSNSPIYTLSYAAAANGSITGSTSQIVIHGNNASTVTATPNEGYYFTTWSDGVLTAERTDNNIIANKSVTASFAINTYTLTSSAGANGTITATDTVNYGTDRTFTIIPDEGYLIEDVLVDDVSVGTDSTYTFTNVTANHTISVTFIVQSDLTISVTAGTNGDISPSTSIVSYGSDKTFTITPDGESLEFYLYDVLVDGVSVGTPSSYTFTDITSNHAILALFVDSDCGDGTAQIGEECDEGEANGGETCTFDCKIPTNCGEYVLYDWKYYPTVGVGSQCWFAENLNIGTRIDNTGSAPSCRDIGVPFNPSWTCQVNNSLIEKYCHDENPVNCSVYGGLYEWSEAMDLPYDCNNSSSVSNEDGTYTVSCYSGDHVISSQHQGICPIGWHVSTFVEWQTLAQNIDPGCDLDCIWGACSCSLAGIALKASPISWDGNDIYNFTALPGGFGYSGGGYDETLGLWARFWASSMYPSGPVQSWQITLVSEDDSIAAANQLKVNSASVRCIKDSVAE